MLFWEPGPSIPLRKLALARSFYSSTLGATLRVGEVRSERSHRSAAARPIYIVQRGLGYHSDRGSHSASNAIANFKLRRVRSFHYLCWDLATTGAVEDNPHGEVLGKVLETMLGPRGHEQQVA